MGKFIGKRGIIIVIALLAGGCSYYKKMSFLQRGEAKATIVLPSSEVVAKITNKPAEGNNGHVEKDKIVKTELQGEAVIMNTVYDEESGETVITDNLKEVVVEAPYKNVAERNGIIELAFDLIVPAQMQDAKWQLRFTPQLFYLGDSLNLNKIFITGNMYRQKQLRGYELYNRFLGSILPDSSFIKSFCYVRLMEIFLKRNFPLVHNLKSDTLLHEASYIEELLGDDGLRVIEHYTKNRLVKRNNRRKLMREKMFSKYVKVPLDTAGLRLDTIITNDNNTLAYRYLQSFKTLPNLKRIDLQLKGEVYESDKQIYSMPPIPRLAYYVSSMSWFVRDETRYIEKIIERNAYINTAAYIDFPVGKYNLIDTLSNNLFEAGRIKANLRDIALNSDFVMDSVIMTAGCSPEGRYANNVTLAKKRGESIKRYFLDYYNHVVDSINAPVWHIDFDGKTERSVKMPAKNYRESDGSNGITDRFKVKTIPENWDKLYILLVNDSISKSNSNLLSLFEIEDVDLRERELSKIPDYRYIRSTLYPLLRTVKFEFYLHRKGMIKDTVHTTVVDSLYRKGVEALKERDYKLAIDCLKGYKDYNTAVAYICMDYNHSALDILNSLPNNSRVLYMRALVNARLGKENKAAELLVKAVEKEPSLRFRVNLDPEMSVLASKYNLLKDDEEPG